MCASIYTIMAYGNGIWQGATGVSQVSDLAADIVYRPS